MAEAYYGANYPGVAQVKARYDPNRVFTFPQAVSGRWDGPARCAGQA